MKSLNEAVDYLKVAEEASSQRLTQLQTKGADQRAILFEQERQKRIRETLAAVQEALVN
ncbi:MAG: hypothetical protein HUU21_21655 [Polyangiaceae bacterium]|nr:hypothetical protein [Planctomycetota bacterium]NUQ76153.1 hypothetical protein [Polyangiaceae bacterium]